MFKRSRSLRGAVEKLKAALQKRRERNEQYKILGVSKRSTQADIDDAFKAKVMELLSSPQPGNDNSEEALERIVKAYFLVSDVNEGSNDASNGKGKTKSPKDPTLTTPPPSASPTVTRWFGVDPQKEELGDNVLESLGTLADKLEEMTNENQTSRPRLDSILKKLSREKKIPKENKVKKHQLSSIIEKLSREKNVSNDDENS